MEAVITTNKGVMKATFFETDAPKFILGSTYYDLEPIKDNINIS